MARLRAWCASPLFKPTWTRRRMPGFVVQSIMNRERSMQPTSRWPTATRRCPRCARELSARVSAAVGMRRQDYFRQGTRGWLRLHEKGGRAARRAGAPPGRGKPSRRISGPSPRRPEGPTVSERRPGGPAQWSAAGAPRRAGDDQAACGRGGAAGVDVLPHVSGDGHHGVPVERRDSRARPADCRPCRCCVNASRCYDTSCTPWWSRPGIVPRICVWPKPSRRF